MSQAKKTVELCCTHCLDRKRFSPESEEVTSGKPYFCDDGCRDRFFAFRRKITNETIAHRIRKEVASLPSVIAHCRIEYPYGVGDSQMVRIRINVATNTYVETSFDYSLIAYDRMSGMPSGTFLEKIIKREILPRGF